MKLKYVSQEALEEAKRALRRLLAERLLEMLDNAEAEKNS